MYFSICSRNNEYFKILMRKAQKFYMKHKHLKLEGLDVENYRAKKTEYRHR